jgi:hypothetical protein
MLMLLIVSFPYFRFFRNSARQRESHERSPLLTASTLVAIVLMCALTGTVQKTHRKHTISFTFDYDFSVTSACSYRVTNRCVQHFNFYDISPGTSKRVKLGSIPVPSGATGSVKGISATTEPLLLESGRHLLAVTAQMPSGLESDSSKCTVWVEVP